MAKNLMGSILLSGLLAACGNRQVAGTTNNPNNKETKHAACYHYVGGSDSIRMQLIIADSVIKGTLLYDAAGRESQAGFFTGQVRGDTLFAEYTFKAGRQAGVREVAFLRRKDGLLEGTGPSENRSGKTVYANPSALTFPEERLLKAVDCPGANRQ
jgi:hypothetical protein